MADLFTAPPKFWRDTRERTVSSAVQGFVTGAGLQQGGEWVGQVDLSVLPWQGALLGAAGMGFFTFVKCIYARTKGDKDDAALVKLDGA